MADYRNYVRLGNKTLKPNNVWIGNYSIGIHNAFFVSFIAYCTKNTDEPPKSTTFHLIFNILKGQMLELLSLEPQSVAINLLMNLNCLFYQTHNHLNYLFLSTVYPNLNFH